ncbi:hypothetical protein [Streptococcus porcorum]|uniref:Uncharacterized protein n=1 Tax=Streptococcus porcorum TaxID=701526 RepID=A0ABV2JGI4_9STRE
MSKVSSEVAVLVNDEKVHGYTIPNDTIGFTWLLGDIRRFQSVNQINTTRRTHENFLFILLCPDINFEKIAF